MSTFLMDDNADQLCVCFFKMFFNCCSSLLRFTLVLLFAMEVRIFAQYCVVPRVLSVIFLHVLVSESPMTLKR